MSSRKFPGANTLGRSTFARRGEPKLSNTRQTAGRVALDTATRSGKCDGARPFGEARQRVCGKRSRVRHYDGDCRLCGHVQVLCTRAWRFCPPQTKAVRGRAGANLVVGTEACCDIVAAADHGERQQCGEAKGRLRTRADTFADTQHHHDRDGLILRGCARARPRLPARTRVHVPACLYARPRSFCSLDCSAFWCVCVVRRVLDGASVL